MYCTLGPRKLGVNNKPRITPGFKVLSRSGSQGQALTAFGATALQDSAAILGLHPLAEAMDLGATALFGLICALRHRKVLRA
jgi:hypothetical protein